MHLLDFFFPKFCVGCGRIGTYLCVSCRKVINSIETRETICPMCERSAIDGRTHPQCHIKYSLDGLTSFFHYHGSIKRLVKAIKYRFQSDTAAIIPSLIDKTPADVFIASFLLPSITIIPIPLHPDRLRFRGFNQAEKLGGILATRYAVPMRNDMIRRTKKSLPQVEMKGRVERIKNMKDAFILSQNIQLPKRVVLIDDVFTTGTTMREASKVLKKGGAQFVWGITFAR